MSQEAKVHVARQPIFDTSLHVFAYELLFRSNFIDAYDGTDGDHATHSVIANSFLLIGIESLTHGKKATACPTPAELSDKISSGKSRNT